MFKPDSLTRPLTKRSRVPLPVYRQEREILKVGADHRWPFRVIGVAPVPTVPILHNQWWLVPLSQDHSAIPARSLERVQAIYEAGIRPKAFVIAHEAPRQLPAPANARKVSPLEFWSRRLAQHSLVALKVLGITLVISIVLVTAAVLVVAVVAAAIAVLGAALFVGVGLAAASGVDPMLIAVTEDDVWIMVDFWMTE